MDKSYLDGHFVSEAESQGGDDKKHPPLERRWHESSRIASVESPVFGRVCDYPYVLMGDWQSEMKAYASDESRLGT